MEKQHKKHSLLVPLKSNDEYLLESSVVSANLLNPYITFARNEWFGCGVRI